MTVNRTYLSVDLGASSGRVVAGHLDDGRMVTEVIHRFDNVPVAVREGGREVLHWNVLRLYEGILTGVRLAARRRNVVSLGIDTWAVDYGLLDADGALLGNPVHYRDSRTDGVAAEVFTHLPAEMLYERTGLQYQPFNTIFQLAAAAGSAQLATARRLLLLPDLLGYWLTGVAVAEATNASTTGLLDVAARGWSAEILLALRGALGMDLGPLLPPVVEPGTQIGTVDVAGLPEVPLVAVGSHDTASAVVGVPGDGDFAYISCGTWSLVGIELAEPVLSEASRDGNFTNELGVDGSVRYLRNVMGLWLLQECVREWAEAGEEIDLAELLAQSEEVTALRCVVDVDDSAFLAPGGMPERLAQAAAEAGEPVPRTRAEMVRAILDSLALAYRRALRAASDLAEREISVIHLVGGGSRNELLCRLTAEATGLPVIAGPVESTALGNLLVQARSLGDLGEGVDLTGLHRLALASAHQELTRYEPRGGRADWDAAEARLR
ncbi:rhamnulokinase [Bogoriella caseilytica]|uniref:Rhamnulokinase n=1 Tax=Bogoriella caseilytica TaxID=56055 RepID=A0A3N2BBC8_9MICO|nr:rhamnulokinase family protein [Bogoriella caseilytica]ROR72557.1 rhamnulokinase [Bogoriella caseilytica]